MYIKKAEFYVDLAIDCPREKIVMSLNSMLLQKQEATFRKLYFVDILDQRMRIEMTGFQMGLTTTCLRKQCITSLNNAES